MARSTLFPLAVLLCGLLVPTQPRAESPLAGTSGIPPVASSGKHCLDQGDPKPILSSQLGIQYGGWGIEHKMRIGACAPLIKKPGILWERSFVQGGYQQHFSPIYFMPGGYFVLAPFSFLRFNVEAAPVLYWPIGLDAAGYYPLDNYESDYSQAALPGEDGGEALGWYVRGGTTLQLAAQIGPVRLIIVDSLQLEHWVIGEAPHYFHNRNDLPAANPESFLDNNALIMAKFSVHKNAQLRLGINDQITMNFGGGNISNVVAGVAMLNISRLGKRIVNFSPILRLGGRTHHPVRQGDINFILALAFDVDLSKQPGDRSPTEKP